MGLSACSASPEDRIPEFLVEAEVRPDGAMEVTESITYDFGDVPSPGLYWEYPLVERESFLRHRAIEITDIAVHSPTGAPDEIEEHTESRGWLELDIGSEDNQVTGQQTYEVSYTVHGALDPPDEERSNASLHWTFIHGDWNLPVADPQVEISAPELSTVDCYSVVERRDSDGDTYETEVDCSRIDHDGAQASLAQDRIDAGEDITAIVDIPAEAVEVADPQYVFPPLPRWLTLVGALSLLAALGLTSGNFRLLILRDRRRKARVNQLPAGIPPQLSPAAAGLLATKSHTLQTRHLLALLVGLEERGVITSDPHPRRSGDWLFRLHETHPGHVTPAEDRLLRRAFRDRVEVDLEALTWLLTKRDVSHIRRELRRECVRLGLLCPEWRTITDVLLILASFSAAIAFPFVLDRQTVVQLEGMQMAGLVILGLSLALWTIVPDMTLLGQRVKQELVKAETIESQPVLALALGRPNAALPEVTTPRLGAYIRDEKFRNRWDSAFRSHVSSANSSGGSGSGGSRGGGSRGGSSGGRR